MDLAELMEDKTESKVGKKLSEYTTRRVIILVLAMLFSVPVFTVSTYLEEPNSFQYGLSLIYDLGPETEAAKEIFANTVDIQSKLPSTPLIKLYVTPDSTNPTLEMDWQDPNVKIEELRTMEKEIVSLSYAELPAIYLAVYDLRATVVLQA